MKLKNLTIRRTESYETPSSQLVATVDFEGPGGNLHVDLAPGFIVRVLALIEVDAAQRAERLAASVKSAMVDAIDDSRLIESDTKPLAIAGADEPEPFLGTP